MSNRHERDRALARYRLSPNDAKALSSLDPKAGRTMRSLAEEWGTDPSSATWVVDRLERMGMAERRDLEGDRRVKLVVLTSRGARTRNGFLRLCYRPPTALLELGADDLHALAELLDKLAGASPSRTGATAGGTTKSRMPPKNAMASLAWRALFDLVMRTRPQRDRLIERYGLTPNDVKALGSLDTNQGKPMRALAEEWKTDPSNVTSVVDRLEKLELAERRDLAGDRRVKPVVLTPHGAKIKMAIREGMYECPSEMKALSADELHHLATILEKLEADR